MAPTWSKLLQNASRQVNAKNILLASSVAIAALGTFKAVTWRGARSVSVGKIHFNDDKKGSKKRRASVDYKFFKQLYHILKILIPKVRCPEFGFLLLIAFSLIARTYCDVWMISITTQTESDIISRNPRDLAKHLLSWMSAMPAISIVNQLLKYGLNELKLRFRSRLTLHLQEQYLSGFTYYKMSNLDNRISNPDQLLTQDVDKFCSSVVELYSNVSKPILDIILYVKRLTGSIGALGPAAMIGYLALSGAVLTRLRKPVGRMTMQEQILEGEFRYVNSRIITNSEEIAFYQGNKREYITMKSSFQHLVDHLRNFLNFRFNVGIIDNIIAKYFATVIGFLVVSRSFMDTSDQRRMQMTHSEIMEDYYKTGRMMVKMAEAIGRLVLSGREMTRLAGFTQRVTEIMEVLDDLQKGKYKTSTVSNEESKSKFDYTNGKGEVIERDHIIRFENVPLVTPNGDCLVSEISFEVKSGVNVLVCGPNGCGKSSLFRVLGELWPLFGGRLIKPHRSKLFYIPQRPYMTMGTLRDQVIYPDTKEDMKKKGYSDEDLEAYLNKVQLEYILEREGGWDVVQDWIDVLSGGEKQRVAMARLFYHKPQFAILDECTSAVSVDVEGFMYSHCKEVGITLFTVSHRKSLWRHHEFVLYMNGRGGFQFEPMDTCDIDFGS
ncbi:ATP-binding cassette sub-family D member 3-like [Rhopilema esculentum]|uniref:ATP-binding cassette sub-family D member 3-like n=1 Tax=Rhopilema esculentum TaxID=499914 RepID=UPI0031DD45CF|eukprot:gene4830-21154_t